MTTLTADLAASTATAPVAVRVHALDAAVAEHASQLYWDWRLLYDRDPGACPLQHADYVLEELAAAAGGGAPVLVRAVRGAGCVGLGALLPKAVHTSRVGGIGPGCRLQGLRLAGGGFLQAEPDPQITRSLVEGALQHVRASGAGFLLIEDLDEQTPLAAAVRELAPSSWGRLQHAGVQPRRRIRLPATRDEYWERFSKKTLSTFRRKLKKFGRTRLERVTEIGQVPAFLAAAHEISKQTWQSRQLGLRVRNDSHELRQLAVLAAHGFLRSYLWFAEEQPVAFLIGNQDHGCFHYEEVGYATPYARFSPGQMLLVQVLEDFFAHERPDWFDFGGGDADYKQMFANHESRSGTVFLFPPGLGAAATLAYLRLCRGARQFARRAVVGFGLATRARQWVRYGGAPAAEPAAEE